MTDNSGGEPTDFARSPEDCAASFYSALGIDPMTEYHTPDGRPIYVVRDGKPIRELWGTT
jgi:hypothetical protein